MVIRVKQRIGSSIPGYVFKQAPFKFDPVPFGTESERLNERIFDADIQLDSLNTYTENPKIPVVYCVSGSPSDSKALYFAAYLAELHYKANKFSKINWCPIYGGFKNELLDSSPSLSLLILSNLAANSTAVKLEKARDLLVHYSSIPRIVVVAGEDPVSFMTTKLHMPIHAMAYFSENLIKTRMEVI